MISLIRLNLKIMAKMSWLGDTIYSTYQRATSGTGESQVEAVYRLLCEWNIALKIIGMCVDTTLIIPVICKGLSCCRRKNYVKNLLFFAFRYHNVHNSSVFNPPSKYRQARNSVILYYYII